MIDDDLAEEIAELAGVTRVAEITGLDFVGAPVVSVMRPDARSLSVASGKGTSLEAAIASGLFEALEMAMAERPRLEVWPAPRYACHEDARFCDPDLLPGDTRVGSRERDEVRWVAARRLINDEEVYLPFDLVHLDLTLEGLAGSDGFLVSTNGLAAGLEREGALLHGLSEVIERDAIAVASGPDGEISLASLPEVDLEDIRDVAVAGLLERCRAAGLVLACWEVTSDIGVPVFYCRVAEGPGAAFRLAGPCDGSGCDPDPATALRRAVTEALQSRLTLIAGARDDILRRHYNRNNDVTVETLPAGSEKRRLCEIAGLSGGSRRERLAWVLARLVAAGFGEAAAVDLSPAGSPLVVVRVVVPGLEGMTLSRGYRPGRRASAAWQVRRREGWL